MNRFVLGIAIATVAVYFFGFAYWGMTSIPYSTWNETGNDQAAGQALLQHFPESGVYFLPAFGNPAEERSALYDSGPTGFVIIDVEGRPEFEPTRMGAGFLLNGVVLVLLAMLMRSCAAALPTFGDRMKLVLLVAAISVVMIDVGDIVWWAIPANWVAMQIFYNFSAIVLGGAILAHFISPSEE